jgi:hypothetical protein
MEKAIEYLKPLLCIPAAICLIWTDNMMENRWLLDWIWISAVEAARLGNECGVEGIDDGRRKLCVSLFYVIWCFVSWA